MLVQTCKIIQTSQSAPSVPNFINQLINPLLNCILTVMLAFTFLLFPLMLAGFCLSYRNSKVVPVIFTGFMTSVILCFIKMFFVYSHRVVPYSYLSNAVYLIFRQSFFPVTIVYSLFFLISKDDIEFKMDSFVPLMFSFYAAFLPYDIIATAEDGIYDFFGLFIKPALFAMMIIYISFFLKVFIKKYQSTKTIKDPLVVLSAAAILLNLCIPSLIEAMHIIDVSSFVVVVCSFVYIVVASVYIFIKSFIKSFSICKTVK